MAIALGASRTGCSLALPTPAERPCRVSTFPTWFASPASGVPGPALMSSSLSLRLPRRSESVPEARQFVAAALRDENVSDDRVGELLIVVSEACTNVVNHASGADDVGLEVAVAGGTCRVVVADSGTGFDPPGAATMPDPESPSGRGLALMRSLVDEVSVLSGPHGTRVELALRLAVCAGP